MPIIKPKIRYGDMQWDTYCEVKGVECDVCVHYYTSPAEPDVNWGGDLEITGVYFEDEGDISGQMTSEEHEQLMMRLNEYENDRHDPYNDPRY